MSTQAIQYEAQRGAASAWTIALRGSDGTAVTTWTSGATLVVRASQGAAYPVAFTPTAAWLTPTSGLVTLSLAAGVTSAVAPGIYVLDLAINGGGPRPIGAMRITAAPGTVALPRTYCDLADMLELASWVEDAEDLGPGLASGLATNFLRQRAAATAYVDDVAMARVRSALLSQQRAQGPTGGASGGSLFSGTDAGPYYGSSTQPDTQIASQEATIRAAIDAGQLLTDSSPSGRLTRRVAAGYSLFLVLRHMPGGTKDGMSYRDLAAEFKADSLAILYGTKLAIDTTGTGVATYLLSS